MNHSSRPLHDLLCELATLRAKLRTAAQVYHQAVQERENATQRWQEEHRQDSKQALAKYEQQHAQLSIQHQHAREKLSQDYSQQLEALTANYRRQRQREWGHGNENDEPQTEEQLATQASAKATTRYNAFRRTCDQLDKSLTAFVDSLSPQVKAIAVTAITLPRIIDPEKNLADLEQLAQHIQKRLSPLTTLGKRIFLAQTTNIAVQLVLAIAAATLAWNVWLQQQEAMAPLIVAVVWLVAAMIFLAIRETAAAGQRKAMGMLLGEAQEIRRALQILRKRGSAQLDPQKALNTALETLDRQQAQRNQAAAAAAAEEERHIAQVRSERDAQRHTILQQQEQALSDLASQQQEELKTLEETIEHLRNTLAGAGSCPELDETLAPLRQQETEAITQRDRILDDIVQLCHQAPQAHSIDAAGLSTPAHHMPTHLALGAVSLNSTQLLHNDGWGTTPEGNQSTTLPITLAWDTAPSLLIRGSSADARPLIHSAMLSTMAAIPPGMVRFTLCDPQHLGESFAPFLALCDQHSPLIGPKVWTSSNEIEQRLHDLSEHGEKVIQKYLRDRHANLTAYNQQAGALAEPYQVLVLCDLPRGCSATTLERLNNLLHFGPRCGISVWLHCPGEIPKGISLEPLHSTGVVLDLGHDPARIDHPAIADWAWHGPVSIAPENLRHAISQIHDWQQALTSRAVPIEDSFPAEGAQWQEHSTTLLRIAIGRSGAEALQYLELGRGTAQHVLIGGRTGSGKSTLLHAIILSGALQYAPQELQFYLVDFKKGVEFTSYARHKLPHARVVAVESDREYALSVLRTLDEQLDRRGQHFRASDVQDLAAFRSANPDQDMPRICLVIDEFHEFFAEDDAIARDAAVLLERFVRQGRAFGMHIILGSQSISGSMSLARSAIGQIGVRIALQCNEADSQLILSEDNPAARLLDRPGEAIYNGSAGQAAANSPFQVFWVDDGVRERAIQRLRALAPDAPPPWSFEGNVPALLTNNQPLQHLLQQRQHTAPNHSPQIRGWLGEPNALKGPCELYLQQRSGAHCLIVGQHRPGVYGALAGFLSSLAGHHPKLHIHCVDGERGDERGLNKLYALASNLGLDLRMLSPGESSAFIQETATALKDDSVQGDDHLIILLGLNRMRALRQEDAFAFDPDPTHPGHCLGTCLELGAERGLHIIAWCESAQQAQQSLNRSSLRWFNHRLLFQMNAADSTELIDDSSASRLGLNHALLCDMDSMSREKFRPYAIPDESHIAEILAWRNNRS
ncbi:MAG: hypothetical protein EA401_11125 [Planctomycetota bacterium]|nr:MAG: hypothetical protein EA401_11125 [Planctomycetota bacterium]